MKKIQSKIGSLSFPENFFWGSAFSGPQTEGFPSKFDRSDSIWDFWYKKQPDAFYQGEFVKNDFYEHYERDIQIAVDLGFKSLRTSIQWTRLLPNGKDVSMEAVKKYREIFMCMKNKGIEPFVNLFHFDTPMWAQEKGGWVNRQIIDDYVHYAKTAFNYFGDIIKTWVTFNEPEGIFLGGYLYGFHYPNVVSLKSAIQIMWNTVITHKKVVKTFKEIDNPEKGQIGTILGISLTIPKNSDEENIKAARMSDLFKSKYFLDPAVKNEFPQELLSEWKKYDLMPEIEKDDFKLIKNYRVDFLGVNYYQPARAQAPLKENQVIKQNSTLDVWFENYTSPDAVINPHRGWEIKPEVMYDTLQMIKNEYGNIPHFVSENGIGVGDEKRFEKDGIINDDYRIDFFKQHIYYVWKSIQDGSNTIGFHSWAYIDNWSWTNAYKNRYGFIALDTETGKRTFKKSAKFIHDVATSNSLEVEDAMMK